MKYEYEYENRSKVTFKELNRGDAFRFDGMLLTKLSTSSVLNAFCLDTDSVFTIDMTALVEPMELQIKVVPK